jgi:nicotinamide mononucleotide transporter
MAEYFSLKFILFEIWDYPLSLIEIFGTLTGLITVWLAAKNNIVTWPIGLVNVSTFFIIFWQVNLYADMFLQVYFFVMSVYGWVFWYRQKDDIKKISVISARKRLLAVFLMVITTAILGFIISRIHLWHPQIFLKPAAYPYFDAYTTVLSVLATIWMARRIIESWVLWILVDIVAIALYFLKGIKLVSIEYIIFLAMSVYGLIAWGKEYQIEMKTLKNKLNN